MSERWVALLLKRRDALVCHKCYKAIEDQEVHMYVNVDSGIDEVICSECRFLGYKEKKEVSK